MKPNTLKKWSSKTVEWQFGEDQGLFIIILPPVQIVGGAEGILGADVAMFRKVGVMSNNEFSHNV